MSKKQAQEPTPGERNFVKTVLLKGEDPIYIKWVTKRKRDKVQDRLIVVGKYRIYSIKKTITGKKKIQRVGHLFDLTGLYSSDIDRLIMKFKDFEIDVQEPGAGTDLLLMIRKCLQAITFGFASYAMPQITLLPAERQLQQLHSIDAGTANGFLATYVAFCDYYNIPPSNEFMKFVSDTVASGSTDLIMDNCPGIERKQNAIDFKPIRAALRHNTYFTSFVIKNVIRRELASFMADTMLHNVSLQTLVLSGIESPENAIVMLGGALKKNAQNQLTDLDLSNTPSIRDKGCIGLADGLRDLNHGLLKLNLAVCGIGSKGITALMQAFCTGRELASQIVELDLSQNPLGQAGSVGLTNWFNQQDAGAYLRYLLLSHTKLDIALVMKAVRNRQIGTLVELDLSGNKIEVNGGQAVASVIEISPNLKTLNVSKCQMQAAAALPIIQACCNTSSIKDLTLNIGGNDLGVGGAANVAQMVSSCSTVSGLLVAKCGFKKEGMLKIVEALASNHSLKLLDISLNLHSGTAAKMTKVLQSLAQSIQSHQHLQHLAIQGDNNKFAIGKEIQPIIDCLKNNPGLTELDIAGNKIGDQLAVVLCDALRNNSKLKSLNWDRNGISVGGWQALLNILTQSNRALVHCPRPKEDMERSVKESKNKEVYMARLKEIMDSLQDALKKNAGGSGYSSEYIKVRQGRSYTRVPPPISAAPSYNYDNTSYPSYDNSYDNTSYEDTSYQSSQGSYSPPPPPPPPLPTGKKSTPAPSYSNSGYDQGYDQSYDQSYDEGYDQGYDQSYDQGYEQGYEGSYANDQGQEFDDTAYEAPPPPPPPPPF